MDYRKLLDLALENRKNSYSPYSLIKVSACLLCVDGTVFKGVNVENASFGATTCAERSAILSAISNGQREFKAIAVASNLSKIISPCGICRQFILEFGSEIDIIIGDEKTYNVYKIKELLPVNFNQEDFKYIEDGE